MISPERQLDPLCGSLIDRKWSHHAKSRAAERCIYIGLSVLFQDLRVVMIRDVLDGHWSDWTTAFSHKSTKGRLLQGADIKCERALYSDH